MDTRSRDESEVWPQMRAAVVRNGLAIAVTTGLYAISFGAIATAAGFSTLQTATLSLLMFSGASQFALVGILGGGGSPVAGAATAAFLGGRNALYGLRLASLLRLRGIRRLVAAHFVLDESTAMAIGQETPRAGRLGFWVTGVAIFGFWNAGTLVGAFGAHAVTDPRALGLDAAAPAAYLALVAPRVRGRSLWIVAMLAATIAVAMVPVVPAGVPVLLAGATAAALGLRAPRRAGPSTATTDAR